MKTGLWITLLACCLASCSPENTPEAQAQGELKAEKARLEAAKIESERIALETANKLAAEKLQAQEEAKLKKEEAAKKAAEAAEKEAARKAEEERVARAKALEERAAAAQAARGKLIGTQLDALSLSNGDTFKKVGIREITDLTVSISHDAGMATIKFPELSLVDQKRLHYDAKLYEAAIAEIEAAEAAKAAAAAEAIAAAEASAQGEPQIAASAPVAAMDPAEAERIKMIYNRIEEEERILADMKINLGWLNSQRADLITKHLTNATADPDHDRNVSGYDTRIATAEKLIIDAETRIQSMRAAAPALPAPPEAETPVTDPVQVAQAQSPRSPGPPTPAVEEISPEQLRKEAIQKAIDEEYDKRTLMRTRLTEIYAEKRALEVRYATEKVRTNSKADRENSLADCDARIAQVQQALQDLSRRIVELKTKL